MFNGYINGGDIEYVLTVPAIWEDNALLLMRSAAVNVSIWERSSVQIDFSCSEYPLQWNFTVRYNE